MTDINPDILRLAAGAYHPYLNAFEAETLRKWLLGQAEAMERLPEAHSIGILECHLSGGSTFWPDKDGYFMFPIGEYPVHVILRNIHD